MHSAAEETIVYPAIRQYMGARAHRLAGTGAQVLHQVPTAPLVECTCDADNKHDHPLCLKHPRVCHSLPPARRPRPRPPAEPAPAAQGAARCGLRSAACCAAMHRAQASLALACQPSAVQLIASGGPCCWCRLPSNTAKQAAPRSCTLTTPSPPPSPPLSSPQEDLSWLSTHRIHDANYDGRLQDMMRVGWGGGGG